MNTHANTPPGPGPMNAPTCARCGAPVPEAAPEGLCPACVLGRALGDGTQSARGPMRPTEMLPSIERVAAAFPQLEIVDLIGAGGMGVVYKARQRHLERWVALKLLPESLSHDPRFVERFHREARVLARLNHPNIVTVYDFGEAGGFPFLLMEFVDGVNLREAMQTGRFTPSEALDLVPRVCEALQFAHEEGVLHRDIKPENILLDARGRVKIADFGIAKLVGTTGPDITLTGSGASIGTPQYMAPEQLERPGDVDHRADIYSLGVVFYEMLTGELPLGHFPRPSEKAAVDGRVDDIVLRALAKERERRQQSATQVKTEVEGVRAPSSLSGPGADAASNATGSLAGNEANPERGGGRPVVPADYVLCHPALPRMAQWITVFALVVVPVTYLLGRMVPSVDIVVISPYARFCRAAALATDAILGGVMTVLLVAGGWKLRCLHPAGPRWVRMGLAGSLLMGIPVAALYGFALFLEASWRRRQGGAGWLPALETWGQTTQGEDILAALFVPMIGFTIWALCWLIAHRHRLDRIIAEARPDCALAAAEAEGSAPRSGVVSGATPSFLLTGLSLVLGLALLGAGALFGVNVRLGAAGGLGPRELGVLLAGLGVVAVLGMAGGMMGGAALRRVRAAEVPTGGLRRALFGVLAWPSALTALGVVTLAAWALMALDFVPASAVLLGSCGAWALVAGFFRRGWRHWRHGGTARPVGFVPVWVFVVSTVLVALVVGALLPAASVAFRSALLASLPKMQLALDPDPAVGAGTQHGRNAMQLGVRYPGRSLVWLETTLWKGDQVWHAPCSTMHVVNSDFEGASGTLLVRQVAAREGATRGWELLLQLPGREPVVWTETAAVGPTNWVVRGAVESLLAKPGRSLRTCVLDGYDAEGEAWGVHLEVRVDPLVPGILGEGIAAANGKNWSETARILDPDHALAAWGPAVPPVATNPATAAPHVSAGGTEDVAAPAGIDRQKLRLEREKAEAIFHDVRVRVAQGVGSQQELLVAERDLAVAAARDEGDPVAVAQAHLAYAEKRLAWERDMERVGRATSITVRAAEAEVAAKRRLLDEARQAAGPGAVRPEGEGRRP